MPDSSLRVIVCSFLLLPFLFCPPLKNDGRVVFALPWRSDLCTQTCPYRLVRLGTSLRIRGKLTLRKKKYSFIWIKLKNANDTVKSYSCRFDDRGKNANRKPSPDTGKVSTDRLTEGASVSRNARIEISVSKTNQKMILTCIRKHAPIASQGSALPSEFGGS